MRNQRPAVVAAGDDEVQLVAAAGAMLRGPERAVHGMKIESLHMAMAEGPDAWPGAGAASEGIVRGRAAVVPHAVNFSDR